MLFDHEKRFKPKKVIIQPGYIEPKSELSNKGVKIIDSWVPRESGERLPYNLTLRNGFLIPIESESPRDIFQYSPNYEGIQPQTNCPKWSDTPRFKEPINTINPTPIKFKSDFERSYRQIKGFGSAERKLTFPTPEKHTLSIGEQSLDRNSPIQEEPSFVSMSSVYKMEGEGSWLSVDSADRSYAATTEKSYSFKIGERYKSSPPPQAKVPGPGAYNVQNVNPLLNPTKGVTIKSRSKIDEYREQRNIPGPAAYHHQPTLVKPSFNKIAKTSIQHRDEVIETALVNNYQQMNSNSIHQGSQSQGIQNYSKQPNQPNQPKHSQSKNSTNSNHPGRHRLIYEASNLFQEKSNHTNIVYKIDTQTTGKSNEVIPASNTEVVKKNEKKKLSNNENSTSNEIKHEYISSFASLLPSKPQPPIHLSRDDVKIARKLLKGILQCTENILVQSKDGN